MFFIISSLLVQTILAQSSTSKLDLIFMVDSSGSVYDANYSNWQSQLDFVAAVIENGLPSNTRTALINYSGCGPAFTFEQCEESGRLKLEWDLIEYGSSSNDLDQVYDRILSMGADDFNGGYTWTNDALTVALNELNENSSDDREKLIILITDGKPFPDGHEACKTSTEYVSDTLSELNDMNVLIKVIYPSQGNPDLSDFAEFVLCIGSNGYSDSLVVCDFDDIPELSTYFKFD